MFITEIELGPLSQKYYNIWFTLPYKLKQVLPIDLKSFLMEERRGAFYIVMVLKPHPVDWSENGYELTEQATKKIESLRSEHAAALIRAYAIQLAEHTEVL
jgi:hypothetical protein